MRNAITAEMGATGAAQLAGGVIAITSIIHLLLAHGRAPLAVSNWPSRPCPADCRR
jgi:hypothetical protein